MKTLAPLAIGDRVRLKRAQSLQGKVTGFDPIEISWTTGSVARGYDRDELHKLPPMRCHCPDCERKTKLPDARYRVGKTWCGHARQQWAAYFCGNWIGKSSYPSRCGAVRACFDHSKAREAAL